MHRQYALPARCLDQCCNCGPSITYRQSAGSRIFSVTLHNPDLSDAVTVVSGLDIYAMAGFGEDITLGITFIASSSTASLSFSASVGVAAVTAMARCP